MKRILYVITSLSHKRAFESFVERSDLVQMIAGPTPIIREGIVPEDYSDFKIKNIRYYNDKKELQNIVNNFNPDVYVEASLPCAKGIKLPKGCKKVYVSHGLVGNHVKDITKSAGLDTLVWKGCDLYCGAWNSVFTEWIKHSAKVDSDKIFLNALPQLDIIYDSNYYNLYKNKVLSKIKLKNPDKIILFVGFCCKDRLDFQDHNEDYFGTAIHLERWAKANNYLLLIKPRHTHSEMIKFLNTHKWGDKYLKTYEALQHSKHVHFITTSGHIYRYFFADAVVVNGCSTTEIEACAIKKPLFLSRTKLPNQRVLKEYDPYCSNEAAMGCIDYNELDHCLSSYFKNGNYHYPDKQEALLKDMGISFDGLHHKRIQDKLVELS